MKFKKHCLHFLFIGIILSFLCITVSAQEEASVITITSSEDLYALSRITAPETAQSKYLSAWNPETDFARFPIPENASTNRAKVDYLLQCSYILTADISISFSTEADNYFMGMGCSAYPFSGSFDGSGHTISIAGTSRTTYQTGGYLGLFNVTKNATVKNLTVCVREAVIVNATYTNLYLGGFVGSAIATEFDNCCFFMENAEFGAIPKDANSKRAYVWIGGLIGYCNGCILKNCSVTLLNASMIFQEQEDALNTQTGVGGLIGRTVFDSAYTEITDCSLYADSSHILNHTPSNGATAACVGNAKKTNITNFSVTLRESTIQTTAIIAQEGSMYSVLSTGGIIGFSQSGSNNTTTIGEPGNIISNCRFHSENTVFTDVVLSRAEGGSELTAGGLVGCSFNNLIINSSIVSIQNGGIAAQKTGNTDLNSTYGTQAGGIVGRLEHTGALNNCKVIGDNLLILSQSPNNHSNAGGIVGIDLGPYHKDVASLNGCSIDGSGNSEICTKITSSDAVGTKPVCAGGIAGTSTYIVTECTAQNVLVTLHIPQLSNPTYCNAIVGNFISNSGWWSRKEFFTPREPEIISCYSSNTEPLAAIYQHKSLAKTYTTLTAALSECKYGQYIRLIKDVNESLELTGNAYIDLSGHNLIGTIVTNGHQLYGMDCTTDNYTASNTGHFNCVDENGQSVIPIRHFKSDITGEVKRYIAIQDEQGWSFHRFYLGITHINLRPSVSGIGYKALFCGDDAVKSQLEAFGYTIQLGSYVPQSTYKSCDNMVSGEIVTLRLEHFDVEAYGETPLSAQVILKLRDGSAIQSQQVSITLRSVFESLNTHFSILNDQQLCAIQAMIEEHRIIKTWGTENLCT